MCVFVFVFVCVCCVFGVCLCVCVCVRVDLCDVKGSSMYMQMSVDERRHL